MLIDTRHTYKNKLKEGKGNDAGLYHKTEEQARFAAQGHEKDYKSIAVHSQMDTRRCDPCRENGKTATGYPHSSGKDLCEDHKRELLR